MDRVPDGGRVIEPYDHSPQVEQRFGRAGSGCFWCWWRCGVGDLGNPTGDWAEDVGQAVTLMLAAMGSTILLPIALSTWYTFGGPVIVDRTDGEAVVLDRVHPRMPVILSPTA